MKTKILILAISIAFVSCSKVKKVKDPITGKLIEQYEYYEDKNGSFIKNGEYKAWHSNELIERKGNYKNNKKEGLWKFWDSYGNLNLEIEYKDGLKNGFCKSYENNKLVSISNYKRDTISGVNKRYYSNGKINIKCEYIKGNLNGEYIKYDSTGTKCEENHYQNGIKIGNWISWDKYGKISKKMTFENGVAIKLIGTWKDIHKRKTTVEFKDDGSVVFTYPMFKYAFGNDPTSSHVFMYDASLNNIILKYKNSKEIYQMFTISKFTDRELLLEDLTSDIKYNLIKK